MCIHVIRINLITVSGPHHLGRLIGHLKLPSVQETALEMKRQRLTILNFYREQTLIRVCLHSIYLRIRQVHVLTVTFLRWDGIDGEDLRIDTALRNMSNTEMTSRIDIVVFLDSLLSRCYSRHINGSVLIHRQRNGVTVLILDRISVRIGLSIDGARVVVFQPQPFTVRDKHLIYDSLLTGDIALRAKWRDTLYHPTPFVGKSTFVQTAADGRLERIRR